MSEADSIPDDESNVSSDVVAIPTGGVLGIVLVPSASDSSPDVRSLTYEQ